jgi:hypothetical protein
MVALEIASGLRATETPDGMVSSRHLKIEGAIDTKKKLKNTENVMRYTGFLAYSA